MRNLILGCFVFFLSSQALYSQKINGKIIDVVSSEPLYNVAIQIDEKTGTYSDDHGLFEIELQGAKRLIFSCLGYDTRILSIDSLKYYNYIVKLTETENNLKEVVLNLKPLSLDSVLFYIEKHKTKNYSNSLIKQQVFFRKSNRAAFEKVDFDLDRSTVLSRSNRKLANQSLDQFSKDIKSSKSTFYTDYFANYYSKAASNKGSYFIRTQIDSVSGYRISTSTEDFTIDKIQQKAQELVLTYLDPKQSYKVKSGLFKVEDSISIKNVNADLEGSKNAFFTSMVRNDISKTQREFDFLNANSASNFLNQDNYKYELKGTTLIEDDLTYVLAFAPRRSKAKFSGTLYVNVSDFAVRKLSYSYAKGKRGASFNMKFLLGIKFSEDDKEGIVMYKKDAKNIYRIQYASETEGRYFYVNRSFKFIENSRDKNKIKFGVKLEGNFYSTTELLVVHTQTANDSEMTRIKNSKLTPFISKETYELTNWSHGKLLDPFKNILP